MVRHVGPISLLSTACLLLVLLPGAATATPAPSRATAPGASHASDNWGQFVSSRTAILEQLAAPIEDCWSRPATLELWSNSPMFNACVDWHSNVHAAYSFYTIYGETGDTRYLDIAETKVKDELVLAELEYMKTAEFRGLLFRDLENPYGMAWLLDLAMKREQVTGNDSLRPLADYAAQRIRDQLESLTPQQMREQILTAAHYNLTWGLIHLQQWAEYTRDKELLSFVQGNAMPALLDPALDEMCPATADSTQDFEEFFPPCLMRIAGVTQLWDVPHAPLKAWVNERVPADFWVAPVTDPVDSTGHKFGINFSRAYTLWHLWKATDNVRFRQNYADLITYHASRPELWGVEAGYNVSHFVPQFGVRAIAASLDDPGRSRPGQQLW